MCTPIQGSKCDPKNNRGGTRVCVEQRHKRRERGGRYSGTDEQRGGGRKGGKSCGGKSHVRVCVGVGGIKHVKRQTKQKNNKKEGEDKRIRNPCGLDGEESGREACLGVERCRFVVMCNA